jgi:hypothetical protein
MPGGLEIGLEIPFVRGFDDDVVVASVREGINLVDLEDAAEPHARSGKVAIDLQDVLIRKCGRSQENGDDGWCRKYLLEHFHSPLVDRAMCDGLSAFMHLGGGAHRKAVRKGDENTAKPPPPRGSPASLSPFWAFAHWTEPQKSDGCGLEGDI